MKLPGGTPAIFGQAIHKIFKDIVVQGLDRKQAVGRWASYYEREVTSNSEDLVVQDKSDYWIVRGYPIISLFYKNLESLSIGEIIDAEKFMKSEYRGKPFNFVCDLIYKSKDVNPKKRLLDYKTGKEKEVDLYQLQLYSELLGNNIDEVCLYYAFSGARIFVPGEYKDQTEEYMFKAIELIDKGDFVKKITPDCKNCYFRKTGVCVA
jgi:hypothetical protein